MKEKYEGVKIKYTELNDVSKKGEALLTQQVKDLH